MKYFFVILFTFLLAHSYAQKADRNFIKRPTLVGHLSSFDFKTASAIAETSLGNVLSNGQWSSLKDNYSGLGISILNGITNKIDFAAALNSAKVFYGFRNQLNYRTRGRLYELDFALNFKLLTDNHLIVPYLTTGIGGYYFRETNGIYAPLGTGIQVNIRDKVFLFTNFQYRLPVTKEAQYHFLYNLSVGIPLVKQKSAKSTVVPTAQVAAKQLPVKATLSDKDGDGIPDITDPCPDVAGPTANNGCPVPPPDTDHDGVPDSLDQCITVPGLPENKGCPLPALDTDHDGIVDSLDKCPTVPGLISYNGCPLPDSDKDGIPDAVDKCPNDSGIQKYDGCPVPDTDGDGINDEADQCPNQPGPATNTGCPLPAPKDSVVPVQKPAQKKQKVVTTYQIYFLSDVTIFPDAAFNILNGIGEVLNKSKDLKAEIIGYTDIMEFPTDKKGNARKRATSIANYLTSLGIEKSRLTAVGIGSANPKASNQTMLGRSLNRRVEIKIVSE